MLAFVLLGVASASVPTLLFSSSNSLGKRYSELPMPVDTKTLDATVASLLGKPSEDCLITDVKTDHVVVFRATGSITDLESLVDASQSSLGLPYASGLSNLDAAVVVKSASELKEAVANGLPRVLVLDFPESLETVAALNQVSKDYIGLAMITPATARLLAAPSDPISAAGAAEESSGDKPKPKAALTAKTSVPKDANGDVVIMMSPPILTGLLAGLVWLTIFFSGFCCLFQLQTQDRFEEKCLTLNKEY